MIFNQRVIKFVAALAIPAGCAWWFMYAQEQANRDVEEYNKQQKEHPTSQGISIENYQLKEVDSNNQVRWQLKAKKGVMATKSHVVQLTDVLVEYYEGPVLKMRMSAPIGEADESTKNVKLSQKGRQRVVCEGDGGKMHMEVSVMELTKNNQFTATGGVNIILPKVAKVTGDSAAGNINITALKDFRVMGNTHAEVVIN